VSLGENEACCPPVGILGGHVLLTPRNIATAAAACLIRDRDAIDIADCRVAEWSDEF